MAGIENLIIVSSRAMIILLSVFVNITVSYSQNYTIKTFTTSEGLTHNNVRKMITDSSGFLWISTWDGLNRYDGYEFKQYHHLPGDTSSFPFFSLNDISVDGANNLWVLADNGKVARYNSAKEDFTVINRINGSRVPLIRNINTDKKGDLWMISSRLLYRYSFKEKRYQEYKIIFPEKEDSLRYGTSFQMQWTSPNEVWLTGLTSYMLTFDENSNTFTIRNRYVIYNEPNPNKLILRGSDHSNRYELVLSDNGEPWICSTEGLFRLDDINKRFVRFPGELPVAEFTKSRTICWGGEEGGIYIYRNATGKIIFLPRERTGYLRYFNHQGNDILWFSFTTPSGNPGGLTRIILTPEYFTNYQPASKDEMLPAVYSLALDRENNLWMGIRGYDYFSLSGMKGGVTKKYVNMQNVPQYYGAPRSMITTPEGIWIGYFYGLLLFYDYRSGRFIEHDPKLEFYRTLALYNDTMIITGQYNLKSYNPATGRSDILADSAGLPGLFRLITDRKGFVWGAMSHSSFFRYDPIKDEIIIYKLDRGSYNIEDILPVSGREVWLTLLGGGLVRYNPENGQTENYTTSSGLSNNTTYSILMDRDSNLWISTDNGISRLNTTTGIIKNFGVTEGVSIVEFNSGASLTGDDGRFYFGGMGGAVSFFPDSINISEETASDQRIILTEFTVSGKLKYLNDDLNKTDTITLLPGEDNFRVSFASSDFVHSSKTLYRYRIVQNEKEWITTGSGYRNVSYANLKPGYYTFLIEATNRNGEWAAQRQMTIHLKPYFYQTLTFRIAVLLLLFGTFHLIISLYFRQLQQKYRQIQDELRLQALRGQMNPHFIFNSLNSINYFISRNDKISANRYISDFSRLIRSILSNMGSDYVTLEKEITSIRDYLEIEHLRFGDKFDYEIITDVGGETDKSEVFPGLIQPFIENAIWHGIRALENRKGTIRVKLISPDNERIQCIIEDDGVGRKASSVISRDNSQHNSRGISIVTERLSIFSKIKGRTYKLEIADLHSDRKDTGTVVRIDIPFRII